MQTTPTPPPWASAARRPQLSRLPRTHGLPGHLRAARLRCRVPPQDAAALDADDEDNADLVQVVLPTDYSMEESCEAAMTSLASVILR